MSDTLLYTGARCTLAQALASIPSNAKRPDDVRSLVREFYRLSLITGADPLIPIAQSRHETAAWTSEVWAANCNPGGIKRDRDLPGYFTYANGVDGARGHMVHYGLYTQEAAFLRLAAYHYLDPRKDELRAAGYEYRVRKLEDFGSGLWAEDPQYVAGIKRHMAVIAPDWAQSASQPTPGTPAAKDKLTIVLVAGHRSYGDAGNPGEKERTPKLARAYRDALRAAGHTVVWLQEADGDSDPDDTVGGLDTVGALTTALVSKLHADVMLDLHMEGWPPEARGIFSIVPDSSHLTTAIAGGATYADSWQFNPADQFLGKQIAKEVGARTGLPLRNAREAGLMSETGTGVAGDWNARLAMFAYTVPNREYCVRLVVEHGNLSNQKDVAIIDSDGFYIKCAQGAVSAIAQYVASPYRV